jgi:predicted GNAT family acetyltransferase
MDIEIEETDSKGRYFHCGADGSVAEMTFSKAGSKLIIVDHTEVPLSMKGEGVGLALVKRGVEDARKAGKKVIPLCPYAAAQFRKHPEWHDVLSGKV